MAKHVNKQEIITVVGSSFLTYVVWGLIDESLKAYLKTDFSKKRFQTSVLEHSHAAAAIVLSVIGIEAYRNRIYFLEKSSINRRSVTDDLCKILVKKNGDFPAKKLKALLKEVFIVRDVIAHNHIYEVKIFNDQGWMMLGHRQKLLDGYGDSKYASSVNSKTRKTKLLKLNVQPAKTSFEDIFTVLVVTDLLISILQNMLGAAYIPFNISHKIGNNYVSSLPKILTYYYEQISRRGFITFLEGLSRRLRTDFADYLPPYPHSDCFIGNICPKCSKLGFDRFDDTCHCRECGLRIEFTGDGVLGIALADKDIED